MKKKMLSSALAVLIACAILFGGTFAWQSISQRALNEISASINPGGRLHDDFVDITKNNDPETGKPYEVMTLNKDVYVENFTDLASNGVQVFARVRLDEYMELGDGAGAFEADGSRKDTNKAVSLEPGAVPEDKSTWTTHIYGKDDAFHDYWVWDLSGKTTYMPTFNKNKDSLEADINGTFDDNFASYVDYTDPEYAADGRTAVAVYDADAEESGVEKDELAAKNISVDDVINGKIELGDNWDQYIERIQETHTTKETIDGYVMTMADYMNRLATDDSFDGTGNFWVWDEDGWAYWANPIDPDTATGLLLDQIQRTDKIINQDWYYAINVVAQFVTADDLGQDDQTGFFDIEEGKAPSDNAMQLLNNIGVNVNFEVSDEEELVKALANGGTVTLNNDIAVTEQLEITKDTAINLNGKTITPAADSTIWDESAQNWSLISVRGEDVTLVIEGEGEVRAAENDSYCVDVRDGAKVVINDGTYVGNVSAVYVHQGEAVITGGTYSIQQPAANNPEDPYKYVLNCLDENYNNGTAKISVIGGTFYDFDPSTPKETDDGTYVLKGYTVDSNDEGTTAVYTVKKTA